MTKNFLGAFIVIAFLTVLIAFFSFPVKADSWGKPIQLTFNMPSYNPSISGDGHKIAFSADVNGHSEIFVINSDGSGLKQLTNNQLENWYPSISCDGGKIAFESRISGDNEDSIDDELFIINSDGSGLRQLTFNMSVYGTSISGNGEKVTFQSYADGDYEIFVINSDGTEQTQLTSNGVYDLDPCISDDGSEVAFCSTISGYPNINQQVFVINSNGTGLKQLTSNGLENWALSITSDGSKVAFSTAKTEFGWAISVVNSDGSGLKKLTNTVGHWGPYPSISGNGNKVAFGSFTDVDNDLSGEVFVINSDGSGLAQLTNNTVIDGEPSVSYDGGRVTFCEGVGEDSTIFVVNLNAEDSTSVDEYGETEFSIALLTGVLALAFAAAVAVHIKNRH